MEDKVISANSLLHALMEDFEIDGAHFARVMRHINEVPAVDAVVHGRWIPIIDEPTQVLKMPMLVGYKCSVCGRYEEQKEPYCNCGAKMDGDEK